MVSNTKTHAKKQKQKQNKKKKSNIPKITFSILLRFILFNFICDHVESNSTLSILSTISRIFPQASSSAHYFCEILKLNLQYWHAALFKLFSKITLSVPEKLTSSEEITSTCAETLHSFDKHFKSIHNNPWNLITKFIPEYPL